MPTVNINDFPAFQKAVINEFGFKLKDYLDVATKTIQNGIRSLIITEIQNSHEYKLLLDNSSSGPDFRADFGTNRLGGPLRDMLNVFANQVSLESKARKTPRDIKVRLTFNIVEGDFEKVCELPSVQYISEPSGSVINWLKWILKEGSTVMRGWTIDYDLSASAKLRSRTGRAIMRRLGPKRQELGYRPWRLPPPFFGDDEDYNFVTRALTSEHFKRAVSKLISKTLIETRI